MTDKQLWARTERYLADKLCVPDADLSHAVEAARDARLPTTSVSELQGKQLAFLAAIIGARRILEIGTLAGYSALWLAKVLPSGGLLVTIENNPIHASIATGSIERAGLSDRIEMRMGNATDELVKLRCEEPEPFDFFFIDADQHNHVAYVEGCAALGRAGSVIVVDNVVRAGEVADMDVHNSAVQATRDVLELVREIDSLDGVAFQTVGARGHDGMLMIRLH